MAKSLPTQIKRSSTANSVPDANVLAVGELAVNFADRKLYTKNGSNAVVTVAQPQWAYTDEFHVDPTNGVDASSQSGGEGAPWKTITYALSRMANSGQILVLHEGVYSETVALSKLNVDIRNNGGGGGLTQCTGNWTISNSSSSVRIQGISWTAASTMSITGAGSVYFRNCLHSGTINKSGGGYVQIDNCDFAGTGLNITGGGTNLLQESFINLPTVNNAAAVLSVLGSATTVSPNIVAGIALFDSSYVYSLANAAPAITGDANSRVYTYNSHLITPGQTVARANLAGFWSINDTQYDRANSTLSANNLATVGHFDAIQTVGNITVGGRSNLGPVGNVTITGGSNGQVLTTNGSGVLSWANSSSAIASNIANGNSNVVVEANGNVLISSAGNANIAVITDTGANIAGTLTATGNVTGGNLTTGGLANIGSLAVTGVSNLGPVGNVAITGGSNGQVLTTNGSGALSWSTVAGPVFRATQTTLVATNAPQNVWNLAPFPNVDLNIGNNYNSSTNRFTAPVSGIYQFYTIVTLYSSTTITTQIPTHAVSAFKNGTEAHRLYNKIYVNDYYYINDVGQMNFVTGSAQWTMSLAAGDYVDVRVNSGINNFRFGGTYSPGCFEGTFLRSL